ncbi:branched-chain amino acid transport system II carrier protein [Aquimarina sp. TRL1]|uniref:branched-chain amino acid transport system II carrier protein n=1 Tax=Aquimarina sp. (strain TRL1) TaxID=2736252 RepID=UPI00158E26F4|nr:branched-chain amino acid transport system II carrier protein [Aquimarina sp. TRL1]QKX04641.1 branched-chain amino acid transport system II carrier protein [Aquimarina sp. TRL1]
MQLNKETFVTGFALFSMFFGAGNLILPPNLGIKSGDLWLWVSIGFIISAVIIPILGIIAHARLQGTLFDFGKKVSPLFSYIYCIIIYCISIVLPSPRTASVTHEMAIAPFLGTPSWLTSSIYFALVLFFVLNRNKIVNVLGKFLTPIIFLVILSIIFIGIFSTHTPMNPSIFDTPLVNGILEGYQTFDAIGAVVVGGVIIISVKTKYDTDYNANKKLIRSAGMIAGIGLLVIYTGMIYTGALYNSFFDTQISRTELLQGLSFETLGAIGRVGLSVLVALACFTTAVGIVTGTSDFMKSFFGNSQRAYVITAIIGCLLGVIVGQFDVHHIIVIAIPALMFLYPVTIVLIILNILPERLSAPVVFRSVVFITILFSALDFFVAIGYEGFVQPILEILPLGSYNFAWIFPVIITFAVTNIFFKGKNK